ncbi:MAG: hypothetical protein P9M02_02505 [Candidatus Susulua stagnicola]|nr:hypothetical protein [Candidatus Susulua stagnicola]
MKKNGFVLIGIIILIVLLAIITLGITTYISEALLLNVSNINQEKTIYLAQAGIMRAIVDYVDGGSWDSAQNVNVAGEFYYHLGQSSNFLLVDASNPETSGGDKHLRKIPIQNINASDDIIITDMIVSWTFGGNIKKVKLDNTEVWSGNIVSPASIDITDFTLTPGAVYSGNNDQKWEFQSAISGDVTVTFIFGDGSQRKAILLDDDFGSDNEFSITATGEVRNGVNVEARRTISATYDVGTSGITSWEESQSHIIP